MAFTMFKRKDIVLEFDVIKDGKRSTRRITLANIRDNLTPDEIFQTAMVISGLLKPALMNIELVHVQYVEN